MTSQKMATQPPSPTKAPKAEKLESQYWHSKGILGLYARVFLRTTQFIFSILIIGLYAPDLPHTTQIQAPWIIAIIISILSAITCIFHVFTTVKRVALVCVWDAILMVVWAAVTGTFGVIFIGDDKEGKDGAMREFTRDEWRMKVAVWVDLVMMVLWACSALQGCVWCCVSRKMTRGTVVPGKEKDVEEGVEMGEGVSGAEKRETAGEGRGNDDTRMSATERDEDGKGVGGSSDKEEMRSFLAGERGLKKVESPPLPPYTRFSV